MICETIGRRWDACIVAATGPSLTPAAARACGEHLPVIAVNDAWRRLPRADLLYACDAAWWNLHKGCPAFVGEKWSSHGPEGGRRPVNDKREVATRYGLRVVAGKNGEGFSLDASLIHYGHSSGFQAVNLAILMGARRIWLIGFDMRAVDGKRHFFGDHPEPLRNPEDFRHFVEPFERAAELLPAGIEIVNCTPGSAITCFRMADIHDAFAHQA